MFVFEHSTGHLLTLAQRDLTVVVIKRILKNALTGIAELHDQDIVHTGSFLNPLYIYILQWTTAYPA